MGRKPLNLKDNMSYKIWYLKHPLSIYKESKEEIKSLARKNNLRIIDSKFGSNNVDVPSLTLVSDKNKKANNKKSDKKK